MQPASEVYEVVLVDLAPPTSMFGTIRGWFNRGAQTPSGAVILTVIHRPSGAEVFRHVEEAADPHVLEDITRDLATMSTPEFTSAWID